MFGLKYFLSPGFFPTQLLTYALIHANFSHLFSNMFGLLAFGPMLEMTLGPKRFLLFYIVTALGAALIYSIIHFFEVYPFVDAAQLYQLRPSPENFANLLADFDQNTYQSYLVFIDEFARNSQNPAFSAEAEKIVDLLVSSRINSPMVGASGAIFGIILAFGYLYPNMQMMLLFPPIPVRAKYLVGFYGLFALYSAVQKAPGDNVAHFAHLGGMLVGFLLIRYWKVRSNY